MSNTILVMGESGSGKSTSLRNLNTKETFIINVLNKPLPFRGFRSNYVRLSPDGLTGNYYAADDYSSIMRVITLVNTKRPDIKNLVIDDFQYTMCNEFMRRASEKGYEKFTQIGQHAWSVANALIAAREDLNCYVLSHTDAGENGKMKCKTIGKMLDDKITLEGMFTVVLHTIIMDGKYKFLTQGDGGHIAKSPMGMFDDRYIDNDLLFVNEKMNEYYCSDIPEHKNDNVIHTIKGAA